MTTRITHKSGTVGTLIKYCHKTVKVCIKHPHIGGAHCHKYWKLGDIK